MAHSHAKLIQSLGGYIELSKTLDLPPNLVWNWQERGISWQWRAQVAAVAKKARVAVPADFLTPARSRAA
jgi:hypothetical protein